MGGLGHRGCAYAAVIQPPFPFYRLGVRLTPDGVCGLDWLPPDSPCRAPDDELAAAVCQQLQAYFDDPLQRFTLPLALAGTPFQSRVWQALRAIPATETRSYGQLARALGSAPRAVGGACRVNPAPIIVPCHRVLAASGLGGYGGATSGVRMALKRWLLEHEGHAL